jgi:hypothetical protein
MKIYGAMSLLRPWKYQNPAGPVRYTYTKAFDLFDKELPMSAEERRWVMGGTAAKLWETAWVGGAQL